MLTAKRLRILVRTPSEMPATDARNMVPTQEAIAKAYVGRLPNVT
jgi:hypothetical protein